MAREPGCVHHPIFKYPLNNSQLFVYSLLMNPDYLWVADAIQLLTLFVVGPAIAIAIVYRAWRSKSPAANQHRIVCVASGVVAVLMFAFAKWMDADIRTARYFLQLACIVLAGLLFGVCMGSGGVVLLGLWRWHKTRGLNIADR
jgi:uncharacterized membrane protein YoaK (UPF0700 family)